MKQLCINLSKEASDILKKSKSKYAHEAWTLAVAQLEPGTGVQVVDFTKADKRTKDGVAKLVDLELLHPYNNSDNKFRLPREVAYVSMEEGVRGVKFNFDSVKRIMYFVKPLHS